MYVVMCNKELWVLNFLYLIILVRLIEVGFFLEVVNMCVILGGFFMIFNIVL